MCDLSKLMKQIQSIEEVAERGKYDLGDLLEIKQRIASIISTRQELKKPKKYATLRNVFSKHGITTNEPNETKRYYLLVDYEKKDYAKKLGCRFDGKVKLWFYETNHIHTENSKEVFSKYMMSTYNEHLSEADINVIEDMLKMIEYKCIYCDLMFRRKNMSEVTRYRSKVRQYACNKCAENRCTHCGQVCESYYCGCIE